MAVRPPEGYVWLWVIKGFDGLFSMIDKWIAQGTPVTPELKAGLRSVRDRIDETLKKLP